jgi:hypothetical protein
MARKYSRRGGEYSPRRVMIPLVWPGKIPRRGAVGRQRTIEVARIAMYCRHCAQQVSDQAAVCTACGSPPLSGKRFCQSCGAETPNPGATVCLKCGVALRGVPIGQAVGDSIDKLLNSAGANSEFITPTNPPKDPVLMGVLSLVVPWLGQIIMGQTLKGVVMLAVTFVLFFAYCFGLLLFPVAAVDAYLIAKKLREGRPVKQWEFF